MLTFTLPYPPTVNTYWSRTRNGMRRSDRASEYISAVGWATRPIRAKLPAEGILCPISVEIDIYPPDRRRRDIDNISKATLDAMQKAGIYADDNQVERLVLTRMTQMSIGGYLEVRISEYIG